VDYGPINYPYESGKYGVDLAVAGNGAKRTLVVYNKTSPISRKIAEYYAKARRIPRVNLIGVETTTAEMMGPTDYRRAIEDNVRFAMAQSKTPIDPIRIGGSDGYSVDATLTSMDLEVSAIPETPKGISEEGFQLAVSKCVNPYGGASERFSAKKYKMVLTTRLDGYSWEDIKQLIDNSVKAKPYKGPFFFDCATNRTGGGYGELQSTMVNANKVLKSQGFNSSIDLGEKFVAPPNALAGYCSWGSNDGKFDGDAYHKLKFLPGALCETFVSTSGRTFLPTKGGQSLIADLIHQGVTGVKGYVSEPFTFALARPDVLFSRYVSGFNLAESFYAASPVIKWKDVVIGDPLCNPYGKDE
jgi:uncharacterized protein (TIGR03790 family)